MTCFFCKGSLADSHTTHVVNTETGVIIVKNVPCAKCTQCGDSFYDSTVAERLEVIIKSVSQAVVTEVAIINYSDKVA